MRQNEPRCSTAGRSTSITDVWVTHTTAPDQMRRFGLQRSETMRLLRSPPPPLSGPAVIACSGSDNPTGPPNPPPAPPPAPNYIRLQSDPGDWVGAGRNYDYSLANTIVTLNASLTHLSFNLRGDQWWYGEFQLPNTTSRMQPGTYANAQRYPFNDPAHPGIDWTGEGRGCNTQAGSFTIDSVTYAADNVLGRSI